MALQEENSHFEFYELIRLLKNQSMLNLEKTYLKNLQLLRKSLKIEKKLPNLFWLEKTFREIFDSK